jgi:hypothetical protein
VSILTGKRPLRTLSPGQLLFRQYKLTAAQKRIMTLWGLALAQIASPIGSSIYFLLTQVSYQTRYGTTVITLLYLKDLWDRLPVHVANLLHVHWLRTQAAPAWWVTARHDARHVLIGLLIVLLVRSLTIGMRAKPRKRATTLRIITSPVAVVLAGTIPAAAGILFFTKVWPGVMHWGFANSPGDAWLGEWLGKGSWQLTLIGMAAGLGARKVFDPVADTLQLMSLEKKLTEADQEQWWWRFVYPPAYRHRFAYLKASGHQPQPHGRAMGILLMLSAPVFLFLLGFGIYLRYFGPAAGAH